MIKRLFDIVFAIFALLLTSPLILASALAVKLTSPGPLFYRARRAGLKGRPFDMLKLRTMRVGTDTPDRKITAEQDDRITPVGRLLRKFEIDELPQFWNVLLGDMSVVGPRPEDWDIVQQHYTPQQWRTLDVRPGITCLWQVRSRTPEFDAWIASDMEYIDNWSLALDLKILMQTVPAVLSRQNAY